MLCCTGHVHYYLLFPFQIVEMTHSILRAYIDERSRLTWSWPPASQNGSSRARPVAGAGHFPLAVARHLVLVSHHFPTKVAHTMMAATTIDDITSNSNSAMELDLGIAEGTDDPLNPENAGGLAAPKDDSDKPREGKRKKTKSKKKKSSRTRKKKDEAPSQNNHEEEEVVQWGPCPEMDEEFNSDSDSSAFASCESRPSLMSRPFSPPNAARKALPVSHYKMQMSPSKTRASKTEDDAAVSSPISSPKGGLPMAPTLSPPKKTKGIRNFIKSIKIPLDEPGKDTKPNAKESDDTDMVPVAPRHRRLSVWGKMTTDERARQTAQMENEKSSKRRHSIDGSMHGLSAHLSSSPSRGRRRLSFFGNKTCEEPEPKQRTSKKKSKKSKKSRRSKRRHSIDGSMHQVIEKKAKRSSSKSRRHSIDGSMHQTSVPTSPRRRVSFFGNKTENVPDNVPTTASASSRRRSSFFGNKNTNDANEPVATPSSQKRRLSFLGSKNENASDEPKITARRRRLSFFGNRADNTLDDSFHEPEASYNETNRASIRLFPLLIRRRLSIFGGHKEHSDSATSKLESTNGRIVHLSRVRRRRWSIFGDKTETETEAEESPEASPSSKAPGRTFTEKRRRSIDNSLHTPSVHSPHLRRLSLFGGKIEFDERPDTNVTNRTSKAARRRHSIDGSTHEPSLAQPSSPSSPRRRRRKMDVIGSSLKSSTANPCAEVSVIPIKAATTCKKTKEAERRRRHSIDGSLHKLAEVRKLW